MSYCSKCGKEVHDEAEICVHCGCRIKNEPVYENDGKNADRFILTFFLGWIGSFIINHSNFRPKGWRCRTCSYFFLSILTFGVYGLVASICNFAFDAKQSSNVGYYKG